MTDETRKRIESDELNPVFYAEDGMDPIDPASINDKNTFAYELDDGDSERWLSDGNCMYCRREKYCSKPCKAQKQRKEAIIRQMIRNATGSGRIRKAMEGALHG